jgi:xylan 1,4-beta-xylosidase
MRTQRFSTALLLIATFLIPAAAQTPNAIEIDAHAHATPFPHFWEKAFGSGRAILALRESYRNDVRELKKVADFDYVRFHAIFHDEVGVYDEDDKGNPVYNFSYVDQIYDGLLANGVRPFVEISFMPKKLALRQDVHPFWYKQIVSPPKDYAKWDGLIHAFAQHLVERYGVDEVSQWYFEVWNEPNIDFWSGDPKQATYFELYDHTARTLKTVNPKLRVGGPATAAADWVPEFLAHVVKENVPVDFVSTHGYADDTVENLFHTKEDIPVDERVCRAIGKVHGEIQASAKPALPLMWTEWNVPSFGDEYQARDTVYVGAALADDIRQCDGLVDILSYWTFDDVFEENGVVREPFYGGFGTIAAGGIKKPAFYAYALLHKMGEERIANPAKNVLVTQRKDGTLVIAIWNVVNPGKAGAPQTVTLHFKGVETKNRLAVHRVDATHGNVLPAYEAMGKPRYPTLKQIADLNRASALAPPEKARLKNGEIRLDVPVNGLIVLEVGQY